MAIRILAAAVASFALSFSFGRSNGRWAEEYFDALLRAKDSTPVARELLLLQGSAVAHPDTAREPEPTEVLWTLAELRAERVLLPPSWVSANGADSGSPESASELAYRLDQEFARIDDNVVTLFEAIRIGSIEPSDADRFVEQLRQLVADSKERIQEGLGPRSGGSGASVEGMIGAFGSDRVAKDLSDLGISLPSYSWAEALPVAPRGDDGVLDFRRLQYSSVTRYVSLVNRLNDRLATLEEAGYLDETAPRNRPTIMWDHVRSLRQELYEVPSERRLEAWWEAIDEYFEAVAGLIDVESEARLIERLGAFGETGSLEDGSAAQIREMQQELATTFAALRREYATVSALRNQLTEAVGGSLVVVDDRGTAVSHDKGFTQGEQLATVANSALVDEHVYAPVGWYRTLFLTAAGLVIGILLAPFRVVAAMVLSPVALLLVAALFPLLFLTGNIWVDPISVVSVLVGAIAASTAAAGILQKDAEQNVTGRAVYRLPSRLFRQTILRGALPHGETGHRRALVVAIAPEQSGGARDLKDFHRRISRKIRRFGGIVIGEEGATVFAAFEMSHDAGDVRLGQSVCEAITELISDSGAAGITMRCGVEVGEILFYVSPIGGYRATGHTITYARRFCSLARKHRRRALFGANAVVSCGDGGDTHRFQERGKLAISSGGEGYAFYSLTETDPPSP